MTCAELAQHLHTYCEHPEWDTRDGTVHCPACTEVHLLDLVLTQSKAHAELHDLSAKALQQRFMSRLTRECRLIAREENRYSMGADKAMHANARRAIERIAADVEKWGNDK